jgi:hypothetical protein
MTVDSDNLLLIRYIQGRIKELGARAKKNLGP